MAIYKPKQYKPRIKEDYQKNFGGIYYLMAEVGNIEYPLYRGTLRSILSYTTYYDNETHLIRAIHKYLSQNSWYNPCIIRSLSMTKNLNGKRMPIVYKPDREILYVTSDDLLSLIMRNKGITKDEIESRSTSADKIDFFTKLCELVDVNYKNRIQGNLANTGRDIFDKLRRYAGRRKELQGFKQVSFEELVGYDTDTLIELLNYLCKSYEKKQALFNLIEEELSVNIKLSDEVVDKRANKLHYVIKHDGETWIDILASAKDLIYILNNDLKEEQIADYEYDEYEEYLISEGIPHNDAGIPLFDQAYDLEDDYEGKNK